jgi:hypothetical protein
MDVGEAAAAAAVHMKEKRENDERVAAEKKHVEELRNQQKDWENNQKQREINKQQTAAEQQARMAKVKEAEDAANTIKYKQQNAESTRQFHEMQQKNEKKIAEEKAFNEKMRNAKNAQERSRLRNDALKKHLGENTDKRITPSTIKASIARAGKSIPTKITNALDKGSEVDIRLKQSAPLARVVSRTAGGFASDVGKIGRNKGAPAAQVLGKSPKQKSSAARSGMDYLTSGNFPGAEFVGQSYTQTPVVRKGQVAQNPDFVDRDLLGRTVTPHILHPKKGNQQGNESALDRFSRML